MCYDDVLRKIYTAQSYNTLDKCADMIYQSRLDDDISEAEKDLLCDTATAQSNRLFQMMENPDNYKSLDKRYIDEENNIVTKSELKALFDSFTDEEKLTHNNNFNDYVKACMYWNNGTLTPII